MRMMQHIVRSLTRKGQNNVVRILSLSIGLAVSLILLSKVYFEQNYDYFFLDSERIYKIGARVKTYETEGVKEYGTIPGGVAPGMKAEVPGVVSAMRYTSIGGTAVKTDDGKYYNTSFALADSCFFDVLDRKILVGDAKEILSSPMHALIPHTLNERMGGDAVGKTIEIDTYLDRKIVIAGVYEDFPENSHLYESSGRVLVSLNSIGNFMGDGRHNWLGNDRYHGYVKLQKGIDPESLAPVIREMLQRHQPIEQMKKAGVEINYALLNLSSIHNDSVSAKSNRLILGIIAIVLLSISIMNYVLITTSNLVSRVKEIATHKVFGAEKRDIRRMILSETLVCFFISIILAGIYIIIFQNQIRELIDTSVSSLFSPSSLVFLGIICLIICVVTALIPAYLFAKIPVANAIKNLGDTNRIWRLCLLSIQFIAISFFVILLSTINQQYNKMVHEDLGYEYDRLLYLPTNNIRATEYAAIISEIKQLSFVENVTTMSTLPFDYPSGNNVKLLDDPTDIFNVADLEKAGEGVAKTLGLRLKAGKDFDSESADMDVLISADFDKRTSQYAGWEDGSLGKSLSISYWGEMRVVGIYEDIQLSNFINPDKRPSVIIYKNQPASILVLKLHNMNPENISTIQKIIDEAMPDRKAYLKIYSDELVLQYASIKKFEKSIILGGIISLLLALVGLIGYVQKEVNRRRKEIAIRKVNGSSMREITILFVKNISWFSIPSIVIGILVGIYTASKWMNNFAFKADMPVWFYMLAGLLILGILILVVAINSIRSSNINPIEALRGE